MLGRLRSRDVLAELRRHGLIYRKRDGIHYDDLADAARRRDAEARDQRRRISLARDMMAVSLPAAGSVVERYLLSRGITIVPPAIRYLPAHYIYARHPSGSRRPVMITAVECVRRVGIVGAHRTWLAPDGSGKASLDPARISTGAISGGAVRLAAAAAELLVGEGLETCLAAMMAVAIPAWAALSTSGMAALNLPSIVRTVIILADHDHHGAGEDAARTAASRWLRDGRRAKIAMPPIPGADFNDGA